MLLLRSQLQRAAVQPSRHGKRGHLDDGFGCEVEVAEGVESPGQVSPQLLQLLLDAVGFFDFSCAENSFCVVVCIQIACVRCQKRAKTRQTQAAAAAAAAATVPRPFSLFSNSSSSALRGTPFGATASRLLV
jgi:hypothetical protein